MQNQLVLHPSTPNNAVPDSDPPNFMFPAPPGILGNLCNPCHSWEQGLNEYTNGLVRQYFPKGTDLWRSRSRRSR